MLQIKYLSHAITFWFVDNFFDHFFCQLKCLILWKHLIPPVCRIVKGFGNIHKNKNLCWAAPPTWDLITSLGCTQIAAMNIYFVFPCPASASHCIVVSCHAVSFHKVFNPVLIGTFPLICLYDSSPKLFYLLPIMSKQIITWLIHASYYTFGKNLWNMFRYQIIGEKCLNI